MLCLPLLIGSLIVTSYASEVTAIVDLVEKKYAGITDIKGVFFQTSYLKDLDRTEEYAGDFFIKKPSRLRWTYRAPRDEEVLINGEDIWMYKSSEKQVIKSRFSRDAFSQVPIAMLESLGDLKGDYQISMSGEKTLELVPRQRMGFVKKLRLTTGSGDFPVESFEVFDVYGNMNVIILRDVIINPGLGDGLFIFTMPPGAELFDFTR